MKLSIIIPCIRNMNLINVWHSVDLHWKDFEMICVSPFSLPPDIAEKPNVKLIESWASPVVCQQLGLMEASGDWITRMVDDGIYLPQAFEKAFSHVVDDKSVINIKFKEGSTVQTHRNMDDEAFYKLRYHIPALKLYTPYDYQVLNFSLINREHMLSLGGWDCQFESIALAELDWSLRMQFSGIKPILTKDRLVECSWLPGEAGDHAPMHHAFTADMDKYSAIYNQPECELRKVKLDNFVNQPAKWDRRFGA